MPLTQMPNGEYVNVPDGISPEALARVQADNSPKLVSNANLRVNIGPVDAPEPPKTRAQRRADQYEQAGFGHGMANSVMQGLGFNGMDELAGGVSAAMALPKAAYKGVTEGFGAAKDTVTGAYTDERDLQRELDKRYNEAHPIASTVGEVTGAFMNPMTTGASAVGGAGRLLSKALPAAGGLVERAGARLAAGGPISQGIKAATAQGALNAAGNAEELQDVPGALASGAALGGLTGGALAGAGHLGARGVQIIRDAKPENAERAAYSKIAEMLSAGGKSPSRAAREIAVTDARGGDAMVQDILPSTQAVAANLSTKSQLPQSNQLIARGEERISNRRANFGDQVRNTADVPAIGDDALARGDTLQATRKAEGAAGYAKGGVMDTPIEPTVPLQKYLNDAPEEVQTALRGAYKEMLLRDENPGDVVKDGLFTHIPNLRTFDYVKRSFDNQIGQALRSGDKSTAQGLSYQLDKLKNTLADANPNDKEYKALLASQRDAFQKQNALDIGQDAFKRIGTQSRLLLRDLKALPDHAVDDARVGIIDALINTDNKADPVQYFRGLMRSDSQRKVMEFAFGGKGNLGRFERWVNREARATAGDKFTSVGRQSGTMRYAGGEMDDATPEQEVLTSALRGMGFGGATGAIANSVAAIKRIKNTPSRATQEEIAKILLSKGENLVKGTQDAATFTSQRAVRNSERTRKIGKMGQQIFTDPLGSD